MTGNECHRTLPSNSLDMHRTKYLTSSKFPISALFCSYPPQSYFIGCSECPCPEFSLIILSIVSHIAPQTPTTKTFDFLLASALVNLMEFRDIGIIPTFLVFSHSPFQSFQRKNFCVGHFDKDLGSSTVSAAA